MIRNCIPEDPNIGDGKDRCGLEFDDVERSTICPHLPIPTREEKEQYMKAAREFIEENKSDHQS